MSFVELSGNKGWIVESARERAVLEKSVDGHFIVENITGSNYTTCRCWCSGCCWSVLGSFSCPCGASCEVGLRQNRHIDLRETRTRRGGVRGGGLTI